ncbi:formimidoylglutamase [Corynebacterium sp. HMSC073D01]|uniref:formimidoylglutamase n=1 Tax=Corynebacterium sp. HMSC073D01 TaxID=1739536 RepID=UPI0008A4F431|nr:formimidoylglutamase [Corynebacterium sp. HMSC073D01]OFO48285.1 formimidoylglutamase [Corynebacterium sp. HMSC073D01]
MLDTMSYSPTFSWTGRNDGEGPEHARWFNTIKPLPFNPLEENSSLDEATAKELSHSVTILGFASDEGVRRNHGRVGAAEGPNSAFTALGSLAAPAETRAYDAGIISVTDADLEGGHKALSTAVAAITSTDTTCIVVGGGHETAYGTHMGLVRSSDSASIGIINFDAHFDLRTADRPTSGTPFKQISQEVDPFHYTVIGISRPNNTKVLFDEADALGVTYVTEDELRHADIAEIISTAARDVDILHVSIDLDVLPAGVAPGVSAPAAVGVDLNTIRDGLAACMQTGKVRLIDIVELNPTYDIDNRTAKVAARLISDATALM